MEIVALPAFSDNYIWLVHDDSSGTTAVVDPGDDAPVLAALADRGWSLDQIWNTHWHPDHTGGNLALKAATGATISGPDGPRIPGRDNILREGSTISIGNHHGTVIEVPGHTLDHIALVFADDDLAFVGDTLFAMGCGRLFEGTAAQMHGSLARLNALPATMRLYPAHEYTLSNAHFAVHAEPDNAAITERLREVQQKRDRAQITLPTTVAEERSTNPFVRASDVTDFARLRTAKDSFR